MKLTILSVAYPLAPMGPDAVGGAEQILTHMDEAIVQAGHRSIVIACEGSQAKGELHATPWAGPLLDGDPMMRARESHRRLILEALERYPIDVVHMHGQDFRWYMPPPGVPVLITLHCPPDWYPDQTFDIDRPDTWLNCVSESQRANFPGDMRGMLPPIDNGVPVRRLHARVSKRDFSVCFGRICPEKAFHLAVEAAKKADESLLIAGEVFGYEAHSTYHREQLQPALDNRRRLIGPASFNRKRRVLTAARSLLLSSQVHETSSLVAMEALACGTPVIAFPVGALPHIIEHGKTGYLVDNVDDMAAAIPLARKLDPEVCRRAAWERFDVRRMTGRYLALYDELAQRSPANSPLRSSAEPLELGEITDIEGLEELEPEWSELHGRLENATPFQSPDWILPWWRNLGHGELLVLTLRRAGDLVGMAPLFRYEWESLRRVSILGLSITDHLDLLIDPEFAAHGGDLVLRHLAKRKDAWDVCDFQELPADSPLLRAEMPQGFEAESKQCAVSPTVKLPTDYEEFTRKLPSGFRRNLRRYREHLEKEAEVSFETAPAEQAPEMIDTFIELHQARWQHRDGSGMLADPRVRAFHRAAAPRLARGGALRLHAMRSNGRIGAIVYALRHGRRSYSYLGGFDPSLEHYSPGTLIMGYAIRSAIEEGVREWDFLRGAEQYKYAWGAQDEPSHNLMVWHTGRRLMRK